MTESSSSRARRLASSRSVRPARRSGPGLLLQPRHPGAQLAQLLLGGRAGGVGLPAQLVGGPAGLVRRGERLPQGRPGLPQLAPERRVLGLQPGHLLAVPGAEVAGRLLGCLQLLPEAVRLGAVLHAGSLRERRERGVEGVLPAVGADQPGQCGRGAASDPRAAADSGRRPPGRRPGRGTPRRTRARPSSRWRPAWPGGPGRSRPPCAAAAGAWRRPAAPRRSARGCGGGPRRGGRRGRGLRGRRTRPALSPLSRSPGRRRRRRPATRPRSRRPARTTGRSRPPRTRPRRRSPRRGGHRRGRSARTRWYDASG